MTAAPGRAAAARQLCAYGERRRRGISGEKYEEKMAWLRFFKNARHLLVHASIYILDEDVSADFQVGIGRRLYTNVVVQMGTLHPHAHIHVHTLDIKIGVGEGGGHLTVA